MSASLATPTRELIEEGFARLEKRMGQIEQLLSLQATVQSPEYAKAATYAPAMFRLRDDNGRLRAMRGFKCWSDLPVREGVIARHRQMTIAQAVDELTEQFGADRAPSKSALARIWKKLDLLIGVD